MSDEGGVTPSDEMHDNSLPEVTPNGTSLSSCVTASLLLDEVAYLDTERCGYGELSRNARI